jgi:hypothetical protein
LKRGAQDRQDRADRAPEFVDFWVLWFVFRFKTLSCRAFVVYENYQKPI